MNFIQLISIWSNIWFEKINQLRYHFYFIYLISFLILSLANQNWSVLPLFMVTIFIVTFIQSEIIRIFHEKRHLIELYYPLEMLGGALGTVFWYFYAGEIGFKGFAITCFLLTLILFSFEKIKWFVKFGYLICGILVLLFLAEPQSIATPLKRDDYIKDKQILSFAWDVSGRVELFKVLSRDDFRVISFERGPQSTIFHFDSNYEKLKSDYLSSKATGLWGLDVILPHYILDQKANNVLLISAVGGQEVLAAKAFQAKRIIALDINRSAQLMASQYDKDFNGDLYKDVEIVTADGRTYVEKSSELYSIIQIYSAHSTSYMSSLGALFQPSSLITTEALLSYVEKLEDGGILHLAMPNLQKIKATFDLAFGEDFIFNQNKLLVLKRKGKSENLVSFLYRKKGWSSLEVNSISQLLKNDKEKEWDLIIHPMDSTQEKFESLKRYAIEFTNADSEFIGSSDNWPFFKIVKKIMVFDEFRILILNFFIVLVIITISFFTEKRTEKRSMLLLLLLGASFSIAQNIIIYKMQSLFGLPARGLMLAFILMLFVSAISSYCFYKKLYTHQFALKFYLICIPFIVIAHFLGKEAFCLTLSLSMFWNGHFFINILSRTKDYLGKSFWYNGLGFVLGFFIYNSIFVLFGFQNLVFIFCGFILLIAMGISSLQKKLI